MAIRMDQKEVEDKTRVTGIQGPVAGPPNLSTVTRTSRETGPKVEPPSDQPVARCMSTGKAKAATSDTVRRAVRTRCEYLALYKEMV